MVLVDVDGPHRAPGGNAGFSRGFAKTVGPEGLVVGLDVSPTMLDRAVADTPDGEVAYVRGDIGEPIFLEKSFDAVCCFAAFHLLPDPMSAIGGLILGRRVPPRIHVDDEVGGREVQAEAARLEADQEDLAATRLKRRHRRLPRGGRRRPVEVLIGRPARVEELSRMLGGSAITAKTRAHAKELLDQHRRAAR